MSLKEEVLELKRKAGALILAHNYQAPDIQDIADHTGDSLDLCRKAQGSDAKFIMFCGVDFMAETAAILTGKKVIVPDPDARCPMAGMLSALQVKEAKKKHPGVPVVLYINTLAEAKAEADIICTSANMLEVINSLDSNSIIFGPDRNMAHYARKRVKKEIITIPQDGHCIVHQGLIPEKKIREAMAEHPKATVLAHPECTPDVQDLAHYITSTNGMLKLAKELPGKEFIIATEEGLGYRLSKDNPLKRFYVINGAVCRNMKKTTLAKVKLALMRGGPEVLVPDGISKRAKRAIEAMMEVKKVP